MGTSPRGTDYQAKAILLDYVSPYFLYGVSSQLKSGLSRFTAID